MKFASIIVRWSLSLGMMLAGLVLAISPVWAQGTQVDTQPITLAAGRDTTISVKAFCIEYGKPFPTNFPTVATTAVTTRYGFNDLRANPFLLRRIDAQPAIENFAQSVSGFEALKQKITN